MPRNKISIVAVFVTCLYLVGCSSGGSTSESSDDENYYVAMNIANGYMIDSIKNYTVNENVVSGDPFFDMKFDYDPIQMLLTGNDSVNDSIIVFNLSELGFVLSPNYHS